MNKALSYKTLLVALMLLFAAQTSNAERRKVWRQFSYEHFASGQTTGVAIDADGTLRPAATLDSLASFDAERVWDLAVGKDGTLYAATGDGGRLFAIGTNGETSLLFDSPEIALHSLALGADGSIYAGSAPDGLIYQIDASGEAKTLAQTGSHYVWDLSLDERGRLYAATGEPAKVLRIDANGEITTLFAPTDRHIMSLLFANDKLYAGSAQKGRIYEVDEDGGRLLYETPQEEVHALVQSPDGPIYAGALSAKEGEKTDGETLASVYRLDADGAVRALWTSSEVSLTDLAINAHGKLLVAVDEKKRLLHLNADGRHSLLAQSEDFNISRLLYGKDALYLGAANAGQVYYLKLAGDEGDFESAVEDFATHTRWGIIEWRGAGIEVQTRSGNSDAADESWSDWSSAHKNSGETITSPPARYIQYKVLLKKGATLQQIALYGLRTNQPPSISSLQIQPYRAQAKSNGGQGQPPKAAAQNRRNGRPAQARSLYLVRWQAADPNEDELVYDLYLRGEGQSEWKKAKSNAAQNSLLWDTANMPEGWTQLKLVASDRVDNPRDEALQSERISEPFAIDNSPPRVALKVVRDGDSIVVEVQLDDRISALHKAQYSIDYGDEEYRIAALDGVYDSRSEKTRFVVEALEPGEHVIAVQAWDALGNIGAQQVIVQIK